MTILIRIELCCLKRSLKDAEPVAGGEIWTSSFENEVVTLDRGTRGASRLTAAGHSCKPVRQTTPPDVTPAIPTADTRLRVNRLGSLNDGMCCAAAMRWPGRVTSSLFAGDG